MKRNSIVSEALTQAKKEIAEDDFRLEVARQKQILLTKTSLWDRIVPWTLTIKRKRKNG